jgi:hypothetical protein
MAGQAKPGGARQERMPLQPLYDYCQAENISHLARMIGVCRESVDRFRKDGIPIYNADRIACKTLGVHPGFIWKKDWVKQ